MSSQSHHAGDEISFGQEALRKTTHMAALVIPGGYLLLGLSKGQMLAIMIPLTVLMIVIDVARLRRWRLWTDIAERVFGRMIRRHESDGDWTGATYILVSVCLTVALFPRLVAIAALAFIIVGDTLAALVGRRFGRHRLVGRKSVEGSLACLVGTLLVAAVVPGLPVLVGVAGAIIAAVAEATPFGIDDNITVPLISGLGMLLVSNLQIAI